VLPLDSGRETNLEHSVGAEKSIRIIHDFIA
jgi:hypothetical protein